jgi:LacI family gluconate utilization system Gnt-I transcriptional repressor
LTVKRGSQFCRQGGVAVPVALSSGVPSRFTPSKPDLRAIFCSSDLLAQGVLIEAAVRGLRVPEDLAVCGFGEADFAAYLRPSLTTVHIDGERIGAMAAQLILKRCGGSLVEQPIIDVGFEIRERDSTSLRPTPSGSD